MSATTSKPTVEPASAAPTFSYAQAAKGRSLSGTATNQAEKLALGQETALKEPTPTVAESTQTPAAPEVANKDEEKPEEIAVGESLVNGISATEQQSDQSRSKATSPTPEGAQQGEATAQSQTLTSTSSSPSFGTASTSTLPKEDDISSTMNASSDSTWDKQSQTSHGLEKSATHGEGEKDNAKENEKEEEKGQSWEKETAKPASLKPAPPPALNIWQQRKEAQEAKAKANTVSTSQQTPRAQSAGAGTGLPAGPSNVSSASATGQIKPDSRKKGRLSMSQADDIPTSSAMISNKRKGIEGRDRAREEGNMLGVQIAQSPLKDLADVNKATRKTVPRPGPSSDTIAEPQPPLVPPPAEDPTSWPTPDTAQDEEKKKTVERGENADKEKNPGAPPRGKDKWVHVPFVPTAVFNTPLPTPARRGGRPARGGREGPGRGGSHVANSSVSGEKWGVGQNGTAVPASAVGETHERGRDEAGSGKTGPTPLRPKQRAMSAGASTPQEQRKPIDFAGFTKRRDEQASQANTEATNTFDPRRRTSVAAQTDNTFKSRQENRQPPRTGTSANGPATQAIPEKGDWDHGAFGETHAHPRSAGADRRSENSFRPVEYFRDSSNNLGPRERGEPRSERGRGGYRNSRGASNGVSSSHQGSGHQFSNGNNAHHHNVPTYSTPKAYSYNERHGQQQGPHYGLPPQQSRGFRSGPRAQSIPNSAVYARFPNGVQGGLQQLPPIQTDIGALYGYQQLQPGIMSAMPFSNPYVEQFSVINMVSMQL